MTTVSRLGLFFVFLTMLINLTIGTMSVLEHYHRLQAFCLAIPAR